jgi:hypothetical protein
MSKTLKRILKGVLYLHIFLIVGAIFTHCTFSHYAKKSYERAKKEKPYDVIIVPGVPYEGDRTTGVMKMRIFWAKHLYDSGFTKNIIFSGSSVYSPYVEGMVMKIISDSLGIPPEHTFSETKAEHSTENTYYSWKMAKALGFTKIALASDPFQSGLLRSFMKRYCPGMHAVPIMFDVIDIDDLDLPKINAAGAYVDNFTPITKRETFWQRMKGTMGKRVKEEVKANKKKKVDEFQGGN